MGSLIHAADPAHGFEFRNVSLLIRRLPGGGLSNVFNFTLAPGKSIALMGNRSGLRRRSQVDHEACTTRPEGQILGSRH